MEGEQTFSEVVGADRVAPRRTALAQVATTAGAGSEAGFRALITDPETWNKLAVQSREMLADLDGQFDAIFGSGRGALLNPAPVSVNCVYCTKNSL